MTTPPPRKRGRPPKNNSTSPQAIQMIEDIERAWELRKQGKTYREIGLALGVSHTVARDYINKKTLHHENLTNINKNEYTTQQLDEIEGLLQELFVQLKRLPYIGATDNRASITEKVSIATARATITRAIVSLLERQSKLLGLDAPTQVQDVTDRNAPYIVIGVDITKPPADDWYI